MLNALQISIKSLQRKACMLYSRPQSIQSQISTATSVKSPLQRTQVQQCQLPLLLACFLRRVTTQKLPVTRSNHLHSISSSSDIQSSLAGFSLPWQKAEDWAGCHRKIWFPVSSSSLRTQPCYMKMLKFFLVLGFIFLCRNNIISKRRKNKMGGTNKCTSCLFCSITHSVHIFYFKWR